MIQIDNKLFINTKAGVHVITYNDSEKKRFVKHSWYDEERLNQVLGLDKPKNRVKAICK